MRCVRMSPLSNRATLALRNVRVFWIYGLISPITLIIYLVGVKNITRVRFQNGENNHKIKENIFCKLQLLE